MTSLSLNPFQMGLELYLTGLTGITGISGLQGRVGDIGTQGPQGIIGSVGPVGNNGSNGVNGAQGAQGEVGIGLQGSMGWNGPAGPQGYQGRQGDEGTTGTPGSPGPPGLQGPIGASLSTTAYTPVIFGGTNLTGVFGTTTGGYTTIGTTKIAWGSGRWQWSNTSNIGGIPGNQPYLSFPSGFFSSVYQFIVSVTDVGGDSIQQVNGDLSSRTDVGQFYVYRPNATGSGVAYFFSMSFWAIGQ
jgi:hypothetical protein